MHTNAASSPLTVYLDGPHIRCRPEFQKRHLDVVVGKIENGNMSRRFGLVQQAATSPATQLRSDLLKQGWDGRSKVTVISDGEPALPNLVRRAVKGPVTHILDSWHISMRVKHIENAVKGLMQTEDFHGLRPLFKRPTDKLRWYLWHGKVMTVATVLKVLQIDCDRFGRPNQRPAPSCQTRQSTVSGSLCVPIQKLRRASGLWSSIRKRPGSFIVSCRRLCR